MKTLYLIDSFAQFFRAYHAIRTPMSLPVSGVNPCMNWPGKPIEYLVNQDF